MRNQQLPVIDLSGSSPTPFRATHRSNLLTKSNLSIVSIDDSDDSDSPLTHPISKKRKIQSTKSSSSGSYPSPTRRSLNDYSNLGAGPSRAPRPLFLDSDDESVPNRDLSPRYSPINIDNDVSFEQSAIPRKRTPPPIDPIDAIVSQVLEIVPDVQPDYVAALSREYYGSYQDRTHEAVLHILFEKPDYPKVENRKRKRDPEDHDGKGKESENKEPNSDYASANRRFAGGANYITLAMGHLQEDFPYVPLPHLRKTFFGLNSLYAPSYFQLAEDDTTNPPPFKRKAQGSKNFSKGKGIELFDPEFEAERQWLIRHLDAKRQAADQKIAEEIEEEELEESGMGIECGCCFAEYSFEKMVQCPETHLFCKTCARRSAEEAIGNRKLELVCMDQSGCKETFSQSQIERFLPPKTIALWERLKQEKALESAEIEGLESCPFCSYSVVIENDQEKLFRCENEECMAVSCRACKKPDHLPKSCKEVDEDKKLDARHYVEEAMTAALTRRCPKCNNPFVKTDGCNKMTCPSCRTLSCYICRKTIGGYDHFNQKPPYDGPKNERKCPLWDSVEARHDDEVAAAAKAALEKYKRDHPDASDVDFKIELPKTKKSGSTPRRAGARGVIHAPPPPRELRNANPAQVADIVQRAEARAEALAQDLMRRYNVPHRAMGAALPPPPPPPPAPAAHIINQGFGVQFPGDMAGAGGFQVNIFNNGHPVFMEGVVPAGNVVVPAHQFQFYAPIHGPAADPGFYPQAAAPPQPQIEAEPRREQLVRAVQAPAHAVVSHPGQPGASGSGVGAHGYRGAQAQRAQPSGRMRHGRQHR